MDRPVDVSMYPEHRRYVGRPEAFDVLGARHFMLLFLLGLREHHTLLDFGCGSLRSGRLLLPYLGRGSYHAIEPNRWLVDAALEHEIGSSILALKEPRFAFRADGVMTSFGTRFDFIHAHSVLTHSPPALVQTFFREARNVLEESGLVLATFLRADSDYTGTEWVYPKLVGYRLETLRSWAAGLSITPIRWPHTEQTYFVATHVSFDVHPLFAAIRSDYGIDLAPNPRE